MSRRRKAFNVSKVYDERRRGRDESGLSLIGLYWGVFEDVTGNLVATWPTKEQADEAARQLNKEEPD